jgi:DNA transformation protein and related proteins
MNQAGFIAHCLELLSPLGAPRARRMFGGHGLYLDDLFVAVVAADTLYLKANAETATRFEAAGGQAFSYARNGKAASLGFWTPPAEAMESPELMQPWARLAMQAALQARAPRRR